MVGISRARDGKEDASARWGLVGVGVEALSNEAWVDVGMEALPYET